VTLEEGTKFDDGKVPLDLLSPYFLSGISEVLAFGAVKYEPYNWARGITYRRVYAALLRHLFAFWGGENLDEETGLHHLWHAGCCLMFLTHYEARSDIYKMFDDRPQYEAIQ
jgi:dATP/dGTP diphosphohydrolase